MNDYVLPIAKDFPKQVIEFCVKRAYEHQQEVVPTLTGKTFLDDHMYLPDNLVDEINAWNANLGLPKLHYAVLFQKHNLFEKKNNSIHIDYNADYDDVAKCALNVPILNFENTTMSWWKGDYSKKMLYANQSCCKDDKPNGDIKIPYLDLQWNSEPELEYTYEIENIPHICKINIPHSVTAPEQFRVVLSMRFEGNPSFEEIKTIVEERIDYEIF